MPFMDGLEYPVMVRQMGAHDVRPIRLTGDPLSKWAIRRMGPANRNTGANSFLSMNDLRHAQMADMGAVGTIGDLSGSKFFKKLGKKIKKYANPVTAFKANPIIKALTGGSSHGGGGAAPAVTEAAAPTPEISAPPPVQPPPPVYSAGMNPAGGGGGISMAQTTYKGPTGGMIAPPDQQPASEPAPVIAEEPKKSNAWMLLLALPAAYFVMKGN